MSLSLEYIFGARFEPASNVHAPLAVSDACLAISLLPFTPQPRHPKPRKRTSGSARNEIRIEPGVPQAPPDECAFSFFSQLRGQRVKGSARGL